jgi:hypothetical protein
MMQAYSYVTYGDKPGVSCIERQTIEIIEKALIENDLSFN